MVDFALALKPQDIPSDVAALAKLHTLDALGVGIAAANGSVQQRMAQSFLADSGSDGLCTVLGHSTPTQGANAALLNGSFIHALEFDDTHMASIVHGSSVLVPAVLAAAEQHQLSFRRLDTLGHHWLGAVDSHWFGSAWCFSASWFSSHLCGRRIGFCAAGRLGIWHHARRNDFCARRCGQSGFRYF
jgi:hypothetical protein